MRDEQLDEALVRLSQVEETLVLIKGDLDGHVHPEIESVVRGLHGPILDPVLGTRDPTQGLMYQVLQNSHKLDSNGNVLREMAASLKSHLPELVGASGEAAEVPKPKPVEPKHPNGLEVKLPGGFGFSVSPWVGALLIVALAALLLLGAVNIADFF